MGNSGGSLIDANAQVYAYLGVLDHTTLPCLFYFLGLPSLNIIYLMMLIRNTEKKHQSFSRRAVWSKTPSGGLSVSLYNFLFYFRESCMFWWWWSFCTLGMNIVENIWVNLLQTVLFQPRTWKSISKIWRPKRDSWRKPSKRSESKE